MPERVGIDLPRVLDDPSFRDNVILTGGDSIHIPEFNPIVMVRGAVNSPGPVAYAPGKNLDWYVDAAGGYTQTGDQSRAVRDPARRRARGREAQVILADKCRSPGRARSVFVPTRLIQEQPSNCRACWATAAQVLGALMTIVVVATR